MKIFNFVVLATTLTADALYASTTYTVEEAAKKGLVKLLIKSKGGYTGNVIEMKITNLSNDCLSLRLEAGRRLDSKKETEQDILVTKSENFYVAAKKEQAFNVFGMCCQAHNSGPTINALYSVGKIADSGLVKLARFIDQNKYYSDYTAQQAVWTVSDNNSLASIENGDRKDVEKFRSFVSKLTGRPIPAYDLVYKRDGYNAMGRPHQIDATFAYSVLYGDNVSMGIYNSDGKMVQLLFDQYPHDKGEYKLYYTFKIGNLPAGKYYTKMMMNGAVIKEEEIAF